MDAARIVKTLLSTRLARPSGERKLIDIVGIDERRVVSLLLQFDVHLKSVKVSSLDDDDDDAAELRMEQLATRIDTLARRKTLTL